MRKHVSLSAVALLAVCLSARAETKVDIVVDNLDNPCGIAIQPESGDVFVSDSGRGRIVRLNGGSVEDVITGFPQDVYGKGPKYNIGPLGLAFLDEKTLVVGGGGLPDGEELLRVYEVPAAGSDAIDAGDMKTSFKLAPTEEIKGEGNFYALAVSKDGSAIFVTSNGDDTKGWVAKADVKSKQVGPFTRHIATKEAVQVDAPVGIAISPQGQIVVGQMGEITIPDDGLLTFYDTGGKLLLNLETGLSDITALAYSPKGQLYATDFSWYDTTKGGLFQLIATKDGDSQGVEAKEITGLDKPTAMVFGNDGSLYITVIGTAGEDDKKKPGQLLKIAPGL